MTIPLFAQVDVEITDTITLVGGLRYTEEDRDLKEIASVVGGLADTRQGAALFGPGSDKISTENTTGKIGLEWRPNENMLAYANISTGFKSGMFNTSFLGSFDERGPVGEEKITAYEIGVKSMWLDNRARLNAVVFFNDYRDFQSTGVEVVPGVPAPVFNFFNAGDVEIYGAELEVAFVPSEAWEFSAGIGLLDTEISNSTIIPFGQTSLNGNEAPVSPAISLNGVVRYNHQLGNLGVASVQADFSWKDDFHFGPNNDPFENQKSYGVVNLRGFWTSSDGRYEVSAYAENVFDEEYGVFRASFPDPAAGLAFNYVGWGLPRWVGVRIGVNF